MPPSTMTNNETNVAKNNNNNNITKTPASSQRRQGGKFGGTHTKKNVPYTRTGDKGTSQLFTGERRRKDDVVFEAMGHVDELCAFVGVVHAELSSGLAVPSTDDDDHHDDTTSSLPRLDRVVLCDWLLHIMSRLFDIGALIAKPLPKQPINDDDDDDDDDPEEDRFVAAGRALDPAHVANLERWIDEMTESLPELTSFVLPTGGRVAAQFHVARTVCRRSERSVLCLVEDGVCDVRTMQYLNRLSDFLFTASRWSIYNNDNDNDATQDTPPPPQEILYKRHFPNATQRERVVMTRKS